MEFITKAAELGSTLVIALIVTTALIIALGAWMQNNPASQAHRNKQANAHLMETIAKERAK